MILFLFFFDKSVEWDSDDINDEQKSAVFNILKQTSYPYPYLLFGPPGTGKLFCKLFKTTIYSKTLISLTGKTKTLIEAILQIIRNDNPNEYILVCATSNSACNEVAKRLLINVGSDKLFRVFSKSVVLNMADIPAPVLAASNLQKGEHYYPSLQVIYQYKVSGNVFSTDTQILYRKIKNNLNIFQVIVCTLTTAGRLSQGKINPKHFSHIFIDEAGSATESQTLIAVAGERFYFHLTAYHLGVY